MCIARLFLGTAKKIPKKTSDYYYWYKDIKTKLDPIEQIILLNRYAQVLFQQHLNLSNMNVSCV